MGKVYLVGAGPGNPELITVRGRKVLQRAGAVLYDNLAARDLLRLAPPDAERLYVGKKRTNHAFTQDEILSKMIDRARAGLIVVRLKGGDPFIFGRGGEEAEGLAAAGIPFEVVPGVTAPLGIAAYAGVPLTHREHTSAVMFVTGHDPSVIDWVHAARSETLVVFMGLQHLREIAAALMDAGRSPQTPAMAVRWGTRPEQQTAAGTLANIAEMAEMAGLTPPATVVIGEVVRLREQLNWFEQKPLFGTRVIVTRARGQAEELCELLREQGAQPVEIPLIELAPLEDYSALDGCMAQLSSYDWIVFTSSNAVEFFFARLRVRALDARAIRGRICAIGPATAASLDALHLRPDLVPSEALSEGVAAAFANHDLSGARVLIPRAAEAREVIPQVLTRMGAAVDIADTYRNVIPANAADLVRTYLADARADWITFTSGSTVKNWLALAGRDSLAGVRVASIGPATSEVARKHGIDITVQADPHTAPGLVEAIVRAGRV